jgi:hypothetical protein
MKECAKCKDTKEMHAKCGNCGAEICASCFDGFSTPCPSCNEQRFDII